MLEHKGQPNRQQEGRKEHEIQDRNVAAHSPRIVADDGVFEDTDEYSQRTKYDACRDVQRNGPLRCTNVSWTWLCYVKYSLGVQLYELWQR